MIQALQTIINLQKHSLIFYKSIDSYSEGTATMITQSILFITYTIQCINQSLQQLREENFTFVSKNEYNNQDNCLVCNIPFEKFGGVSQHHWACGASVCQPCSRRQINQQKVCDLCFLKCFLKKTEQRRREQLNTKVITIQQLMSQQDSIKKEIKKVENDIINIKYKTQELEQFKKALKKKNEELEYIGKELTQQEQILVEKENQLKEEKKSQQELEKQQIQYDSQLKGIQIELDQNKKLMEQKQSQVKNLMDQKNKLTNTKSFLNFKQSQQNEAYNESDEEQDNEDYNNYVDQDANINTDRSSTPGNHYKSSSMIQNPPKNYELNEKQNPNDKCFCSVF